MGEVDAVIEIVSVDSRPVGFEIGQLYRDGMGTIWWCQRPRFGSLPEFIDKHGRRIVRARDGRYRFDGVDDPRDIVQQYFPSLAELQVS